MNRQRPLRRRRHRLRGPDPGQSVGAKRQKLRTSVESDRHQRQQPHRLPRQQTEATERRGRHVGQPRHSGGPRE
jgi:hypothetical protein